MGKCRIVIELISEDDDSYELLVTTSPPMPVLHLADLLDSIVTEVRRGNHGTITTRETGQ